MRVCGVTANAGLSFATGKLPVAHANHQVSQSQVTVAKWQLGAENSFQGVPVSTAVVGGAEGRCSTWALQVQKNCQRMLQRHEKRSSSSAFLAEVRAFRAAESIQASRARRFLVAGVMNMHDAVHSEIRTSRDTRSHKAPSLPQRCGPLHI